MEVSQVEVREGKMRLKADGFVAAGSAGPPSGGLGVALQAVGSPGAVQSRSDTPSGLFHQFKFSDCIAPYRLHSKAQELLKTL